MFISNQINTFSYWIFKLSNSRISLSCHECALGSSWGHTFSDSYTNLGKSLKCFHWFLLIKHLNFTFLIGYENNQIAKKCYCTDKYHKYFNIKESVFDFFSFFLDVSKNDRGNSCSHVLEYCTYSESSTQSPSLDHVRD